jgi:O-6-methylguanine DNA methyltransferase
MYIDYYNSPIGLLKIKADNQYVYMISSSISEDEAINENGITKKVKKELEEYFFGKRKEFSLKVKLEGTEFQMSVWNALMTIPYGETCSYKDIAIKVNNPKAAIAVGGANHNNKILLVIPCHRVIGANKSLVGFGLGLEAKKYLLDLEQDNI